MLKTVKRMLMPAGAISSLGVQANHCIVNSLHNGYFGCQEICPYIELSLLLPRDTIAVRMQ